MKMSLNPGRPAPVVSLRPNTYSTFADACITLPPGATGEIAMPCPKCSAERKKQDKPDLKVNVEKQTWYCHHCGWKGGLANGRDQSITLADLARDKRLPESFLRELGVRDILHAVGIPYHHADGSEAYIKRRTALRARDGSFVPKGEHQLPYGLERLQAAREAGHVVLVEGESDCWTGWYHGYPMLGIPGATSTKVLQAEHLAGIGEVYAVQETDSAGAEFIQGLRRRLLIIGYRGALHVAHLPTKDTNELHKRDPDGFTVAFEAALKASESPDTAGAEQADEATQEPRSSSAPGAGEEPWLAPAMLPDGLPPVAELDEALLPDPLRAWIMDISDRMQAPPDYSAATVIVALSSLIGRRLGIHPKRHDDWLAVPNLWGGVVGRPAMMKTPSIAEALKPLNRLVADAIEAHVAAIQSYQDEMELHEARKTARKQKLVSAAKKGSNMDAISREEAPQAPIMRRYKTDDPTIEKLCEILKENPQGMLVFRDELVGWLRGLDKQGREGDRAFYLEAWSGTVRNYTIDRIGRGTIIIPELCVSVFGGIQPGPLSSYVYATHQGGTGDDGLLQRFQVLVWPDPPATWHNVDRWPDTEAKTRAYKVFQDLNALAPAAFGLFPAEDGDVPAIRFSPPAQELFNEWRHALEQRLRSGELLHPALESHLAKYRSLMPSLALIFHLVACASSEWHPLVREEHAALAAAWCEYLESHAKRLYASALDPGMESAHALFERLRRGDVQDGFSLRDIYRNCWLRLTTPDEAQAAVRVLEEFGWIRSQTIRTGGRPTTQMQIHPSLRPSA